MNITIVPLNDSWIRLDCDDSIARELYDYFSFDAPNSQYMQRQTRYRRWDGRIRLFKLRTRTLYRGLAAQVEVFAKDRDYTVDNQIPTPKPLHSNVAPGNLPFEARDYQAVALRTLLDTHRGIILSPTGSGKSFIIYLLTQAIPVKTLIVVPTIGLVEQMASDFKSYGFDLSKLHTISAGKAKDSDAGLFVSTWQSIHKMPPEYFSQFGCIIVDEVHGAKAKSLSHILEMSTETPFRFGFTGTLDDTQSNRLILEGLFGPVTRVATTAELIKKEELAPLHVRLVFLKHPTAVAKAMRKAQYDDEIDYIVRDGARAQFCADLAGKLKGNVLVLFNFVGKQGLPLFERIQANTDKDCHYVSGDVSAEDREAIRQHVEAHDNQIIVASYGTFSTGMNIKNLSHLILASPSKSKIRVIQSIGRTLRVHENKTQATLWDLIDNLNSGKHVCYAMKHGEIRADYYTKEKFPIQVSEISLERYSLYAGQEGYS